MLEQVDPRFYQRADEYIQIANQQMTVVNPQRVSASMLWSAARYTAWMSAQLSDSQTDMVAKKDEALAFFVEQFQQLLSEHYDEYVKTYDEVKQPSNS